MTKPMIFRNWALAVLAVLVLGACNRDWDSGRMALVGADSAAADQTRVQDARGAGGNSPGASKQELHGLRVAAAAARAPFADLPDRGNLVGYPREPVVRRMGAYTWHRADVSEEHAIRAIVDGELRVTAPDGELLAFEYERHVEHPTGDWTWVGRLRGAPPGRQAILTFGAKAVFGSIARSVAEPLRLTMRDGGSWLVETDPAMLAGVESRVLREESPDFLLPPSYMGSLYGPRAHGEAVVFSGSSVESSSSTSSTSSTATVVDVVVGYTPGFAVAQGGDSQARTRINYLVDVGNQAYANSEIDARVRLVHAMQVDYPDATDNGEALQQLTGYDTSKSGSDRFVTPDPRFSSLRQARETYGADLVTLVRKFNDPENDGCGIAWLIGGGLTNITQGYEYFGYSVVSDGIDQGDDGKNYFCRDETMVHEFGHNMGSAHDVETAKGDDGVLDDPDDYGRYRYSFGYRTGPEAGDFYTIMAYREKRDSPPYQTPYRVFSNSNITFCGGFPCGTSNAHNAHSLSQTIPVIAGFRAQVVPDDDPIPQPGIAHSDFDGDGKSDLVWRHAGTGANSMWLSADSGKSVAMHQVVNLKWQIVGVGDFDGYGNADILWRNQGSGANAIWNSGDYAKGTNLTPVGDIRWEVVGIGDFDANGRSDILWRHASSGANAVWPSAVYELRYNLTRISNMDWKVVGVGDVDGDGRSDIIWRNHATGANAVWYRGQYSLRKNLVGVSDLNWRIVGVADFDGDGKDDLLWRHSGTGANAIWPAASHGAGRLLVTISDLKWRVEDTGDYDGDGRADIIWRHAGTGANAIWPAADYGKRRNLYRVADLKWQIQP